MKLTLKEISRTEHENMNIHLSLINAQATALLIFQLKSE